MKNAEKAGEAEAQRLKGRVGPEDAEEVASYEQDMSVHVHALEHMCGYLSAIGTRIVSALVLRVRSPGVGVQCSVLTKLVKRLLTLSNSSYRMSLSEHICVHQALGYLTCRWRFACRHPGSRKLTPSLLTLSSLSTPKSRAGTLGHSADLK